jgi:hypothetical protein
MSSWATLLFDAVPTLWSDLWFVELVFIIWIGLLWIAFSKDMV